MKGGLMQDFEQYGQATVHEFLSFLDLGELPNVKCKTSGGEHFWEEAGCRKNLRLQKNQIFGQYRILDGDGRRIAWGSEDVMREKFKRLTRTDFLEPGDIIGVSRGIYEHYAVYVGAGAVIHYNGQGGKLRGDVTIHEADFEEFLKFGKNCFVLYFEDEYHAPKKIFKDTKPFIGDNPVMNQIVYTRAERIHLYTPEETIRRAKERIGENGYNLIANNCEHFALWCKTGVSMSFQVQRVNLQKGIFDRVVSMLG